MTETTNPIWSVCAHFAILSMMAVGGGVIMLAPDIYRFVVDANHLIAPDQFAVAYAIAQAAPGPNLLYVTLIGWQIAGLPGALAATAAIVVPPSTLTLIMMRVSSSRPPGRFSRAVRIGLGPVSVGLLAAGGVVLVRANDAGWSAVALTALTVAVMVRTRINPVWLIALGAVVGVFGLV